MATGKPGLKRVPEASPDRTEGPDLKLSNMFLTMPRDGRSKLVWGPSSSEDSTTPCSTAPPELVSMALALLMASSSSLAEVGNGGFFFLALDEEWWTSLMLEL